MRAEIENAIKGHWDAERAKRQLAKAVPLHWPPECDAYLKAWQEARRNLNKRNADHYVEAAYEAWYLAVSSSFRAQAVLGPWRDEIEEFEKLPAPLSSSHHVKSSKPEIRAKVMEDFKRHPEHYQPGQNQAPVKRSLASDEGKPNMMDIVKKIRG